MFPPPPHVRLDVERSREASRTLREVLRSLVPQGQADPRLDDVLLAASELVTNAVVHAAGPIGIEAWRSSLGWRVEVSDGSPDLPAARTPPRGVIGGHGLDIIRQVTSACGSRTNGRRKCCWFEITV